MGVTRQESDLVEQTYKAAPDIDVLPMYFPIPGFGSLPINAFVLKGQEPVLIDTGSPLGGDGADATEDFMESLRQVIDPRELKWIWLTHADMDHVGSVHQILEEAPEARVITTFLTVGRMSLFKPLPLDRVHLLNPGQSLDVGDRTLTSVKPPSFDAADTAGLYDSKSKAFFSSDCFGALLPGQAEAAGDVAESDLREGQLLWATLDAPWLHKVDSTTFAASLNEIREMDPEMILSSHLPAAHGMTERLLSSLAAAPTASPFVGSGSADGDARADNGRPITRGSQGLAIISPRSCARLCSVVAEPRPVEQLGHGSVDIRQRMVLTQRASRRRRPYAAAISRSASASA
jgi:glyoxylase-like metal-dependent hydrolase (beta-lactamase superfamily II)